MKTINVNFDDIERYVDALGTIGRGFKEAADALGALLAPFKETGGPRPSDSLTEKFKGLFEATRPGAKPVQQDLPGLDKAPGEQDHRARLGDFGFEDEFNPVRQAVGQLGADAASKSVRAVSPDRRARGTVMVKLMAVNEKRRYWRWAKDRAKCRKAGLKPPTWSEWTGA